MICSAFRVLLPVHPAERVEQQVTGGSPTAPPVTEHARLSSSITGKPVLTAGTADLWRELVHLCWETPT